MHMNECVIPLYAMEKAGGYINYDKLPRFVGTGFHFNKSSTIATCSHIVKSLTSDEGLVTIDPYSSSFDVTEITNIRCHQKYDFAVGDTNREVKRPTPIHHGEKLFLGDDLISFGYVSDGIENGQIIIHPRMMKGHIVRIHRNESKRDIAKSTLEVSFASLNGFSGAPIFSNSYYNTEAPSHKSYYIAGMLYGNSESSITVFSTTEIMDGDLKYKEEVHRVIELGLAHTAQDIRLFLKDLNVTDVLLDHKNS